MNNNLMRVDDVARELDCSKAHAYKVMRQFNKELQEKGYFTVSGRLSRAYFNDRVYGENHEQRVS